MTRPRTFSRLLVLVLVVPLLAVVPAASADPACAEADHPGGDWRTYGQNLDNTRTQALEDRIGPDTVADLEVAWVFDTPSAGTGDVRALSGATNNTPIVGDGCVYVADSNGWVDALNAESGEPVWSTQVEIDRAGFGGGLVGSPALYDGMLLVIVNDLGKPYVEALDQHTGESVWKTVITPPEMTQAMTNASVVVHDGMVFAGFSGASAPPPWPGGYTILNADSASPDYAPGEIILTEFTIPWEDFAEHGYGGGSIWSTAAIDTETRYLYVGTGNPHSLQKEHQNTNSIAKIDFDPNRDTFGQIVGLYKGESDGYVDGLNRTPVCDHFGDRLTYPAFGFSYGCGQLDLDFGASPNLFTDYRGHRMVGALQKSGVFHVADADTMARAWTTVVGYPCLACNAASAAYADGSIFTAAGPPGQLFSLNASRGDYEWVGVLAGNASTYNPISVANGVVYSITGAGLVMAFDQESGAPLAVLDMNEAAGDYQFSGSSSAGIAIARNKLYVNTTAGYLIVYHLPD
jgi:polyvinyl alcohol dehydrogenase (cytochrome)